MTFKYDGSTIVPGEQGAEYQDFIQQCTGRETRFLGEFLIFWEIVKAWGGATEAKLGGAVATLGAAGAAGTRFERFKTSSSLLPSGHPE